MAKRQTHHGSGFIQCCSFGVRIAWGIDRKISHTPYSGHDKVRHQLLHFSFVFPLPYDQTSAKRRLRVSCGSFTFDLFHEVKKLVSDPVA